MTDVAFTGTRKGMTIVQWERFNEILHEELVNQKLNEWHDGDCIGADQQAHATVQRIDGHHVGPKVRLHGHPCNLDTQRAWMDYDVTHRVETPLVRNKIMVDASELLLATPHEYEEVLRGSGTWATMRYAVKTDTRLRVIFPDGTDILGTEETLKLRGRV